MNNIIYKLNEIIKAAKLLYDENKWEDLEEYADKKQDEFLRLCGRIVKDILNSDDDKWEAWATICGSHAFDRGTATSSVSVSIQDGIKINGITTVQ